MDYQEKSTGQGRQEMNSVLSEAEILDWIFANGRNQAEHTIRVMTDEAVKDPELSGIAQWYILLAGLHLAKMDRKLALAHALEFIEVDQGNDVEIHELVQESKEGSMDAIYSLCVWYHEDERCQSNPYLSAVVYHLGQHLCQMFRANYFKIEEEETRAGFLESWIDIALRMGEDGDLEPVRIGLYQGDPLCCSLLDDKSLVQRLGLSQEEEVAYLFHAWDQGYDVEYALYEAKKDKKDVFTESYLLRWNRLKAESRVEAKDECRRLERLCAEALDERGL